MGDRDEPPVILLRHHPRSIHESLGRHSTQRQKGIRKVCKKIEQCCGCHFGVPTSEWFLTSKGNVKLNLKILPKLSLI